MGIVNNFHKACRDKHFYCTFAAAKGDLAHLVERQVRNLKVAGSSPVISTRTKKNENDLKSLSFFCLNDLG